MRSPSRIPIANVVMVTADVLKKLELVGKDLDAYLSETMKMFYEDPTQATR
jgi:hypothetical protein